MKPLYRIFWVFVFTVSMGLPFLGIPAAAIAVAILLLKIPHLRYNVPAYDSIVPMAVFIGLLVMFGLFWIDRRFKRFDNFATKVANALIPEGQPDATRKTQT